MFSCVLSRSESLMKDLKRFLMFEGYFEVYLSRSEVFSWVVRGCERFLNVMKCSLILWGILRCSGAFGGILMDC